MKNLGDNLFIVNISPNYKDKATDLKDSIECAFEDKQEFRSIAVELVFFAANRCFVKYKLKQTGRIVYLASIIPKIIREIVSVQQSGIEIKKTNKQFSEEYPVMYECIKTKQDYFLCLACFHVLNSIYKDALEILAPNELGINFEHDHIAGDARETIRIYKEFAQEAQAVPINRFGLYANQFIGPEAIKAYLDLYVQKQELSKWYAAQLLYEKIQHIQKKDNIKQTDLLMIGPTGCGKTYIWEVLAKISPVTIAIIDSTEFTSQGFKGKDKEDVLFEVLSAYPGIEHGFIVLDEFDKRCIPMHDRNGDNVNAQIQAGLLKMIEGHIIRRGDESIDTNDITFVFAGAFSSLYKKIKTKKNPIGFAQDVFSKQKNAMKQNITNLLIEEGMIPEMAGRLNNFVFLHELTEKDYYVILTSVRDNITVQIKEKFQSYYGISIQITKGALHAIASIAYQQKLGARGMNGILEQTCRRYLVDVRKAHKKILKITEKRIYESQLALLEEEQDIPSIQEQEKSFIKEKENKTQISLKDVSR